MLSCTEICKALSSFEDEKEYKLENYNPLFEQAPDFSKKYLQLVEDKIKENDWIDPNLQPKKFQAEIKHHSKDKETPVDEMVDLKSDEYLAPVQQSSQSTQSSQCFLSYKEHQTLDLPEQILSAIVESRRKQLYYYGMKGPDSFLASILLGADPNYWLQHRKKKKEYAAELKTTFCIQKYDILRGLSKDSVGNDYTKVIYSEDFPERIDSDTSKEFQFLISVHYKLNVLILNLQNMKGHFVSDWNTSNKTIVLILDNQTYLPILSNGIPYFDESEVQGLEKSFNILYPIKTETKSAVSLKNMIKNATEIDIKVIKPEHIQNVSKYQLKDLQDMSEVLGLDTEYKKTSTDGKITKTLRKTKQQLYDDIIEKIKSFAN
jgi:hypothetical protein